MNVAAAWLRVEDWPEWRRLDPMLPDTFEQWRVRMERRVADLAARGVEVQRIEILPAEVVAFAAGVVTSSTRAALAARKLAKAKEH